jgi:hypothetical protein
MTRLTKVDAQCPDMKFAAAQSKDGTLQGYYQLPAALCYKLPDVCHQPQYWVDLSESIIGRGRSCEFDRFGPYYSSIA